ncbi:nose resistant to fluoxetine protein 6-like [Ylistrum balloti]|uniref:nose resistant to fluoxetine protein 6-like n=1 Tax=Ylistrum balloti TaxID=509963 RepID=UPI002905963C|nr:nose resistant to fluoxetine protein 6-like [Ylistrum balloti]
MTCSGCRGLLHITTICCIWSFSQSTIPFNHYSYRQNVSTNGRLNSTPTGETLVVERLLSSDQSSMNLPVDHFKRKTPLSPTPVSTTRALHHSSKTIELEKNGIPTGIVRNGTSIVNRTALHEPKVLPEGTTLYRSWYRNMTEIDDTNPGQNTSNKLHQTPSVFQSNINNLFLNALQGKEIQALLSSYIHSNNIGLPMSIITQENLKMITDALLLHASGNDTAFLQLLFGSGITLPPDMLKKFGRLYGNDGNIDISDIISHLTNDQIKVFSDFIIRQFSPVSTVCWNHLIEITTDNVTALKMIDASGKVPAMVLQGNFKWTGSFDECLSFKSMGESSRKFDGKYCTATIPLDKVLVSVVNSHPVNAELGLCVPSTCNRHEIKLVMDLLMGLVPFGNTTLYCSEMTCQETPEYDTLAIATIMVFTCLGLFILFATLMDIRYTKDAEIEMKESSKNNEKQISDGFNRNGKDATIVTYTGVRTRLLISFSMYTNGLNLLNTNRPSDSLGAVNGIRFLGVSWIILGHTVLHISSSGIMANQLSFVPAFLQQWSAGVVVNSVLSVDTFFTLSGLLLSYVFMKEMKRLNGHINWFMFYLHRFWRLTPPYMLVMFIYVALLRYTGDGPFWQENGFEKDFCAQTWWRNLLYINNFFDTYNSCMVWTWYLANDMQFYITSPLLLVPLYFSRRLGGLMCGVFLLGITITTYAVSYYLHLSAVLFNADTKLEKSEDDYFTYYFVRPYCRMGPYIVGIVAGYILYLKERSFKISKGLNTLTWFLMTLLGIVVTYGVYGPMNGVPWDNSIAALYNATHRTMWSLCVSWVVFACVTGHGGFINTVLSWKAFEPLGRLTYCVYLVHPILLYYFTATMRQTIYVTNYTLIYIFLGTLVSSYMLAFLTSLVFEAPMRGLEKVLFKRKRK